MTEPAADTLIDTRGLTCPLPVLKLKKALRDLKSGTLAEVLSTDPGSVVDFETLCEVVGHEIVTQSETDGEFRFLIRRK